ncbi:CHC2-type zinc finger protein [Aquimarina sp. MAR_2010_214]|uniref:toprim domain-containing protein n=1 Tax=Aquimarina sp. MAR_2010_214 TaxID=1250026 RepID=UPI000C70CB0B|nr:toprim domain-containing protein [Aquimarina sp. MAR_2010_214]PKV51882.1 CHC2-type zinc finger protein [Aquimarina sp. MAR_2010_214]
MKRKINCETARNFSIVKALEKLGHFPKKSTEKEAWFLSPFRSETQASFKVSKTKNRWYDHGEGIGGNVIDLVCKILKCSIKETLAFLNDSIATIPFKKQLVFNEKETGISILKVQDIIHPALIQYVDSRNITLPVVKTYCKEVWYTYKGSQYFAIGLNNNRGGWELRNKIFKNCCSPKSYTYIKRNCNQLVILEGMFDLLSLVMMDDVLLSTSDILVLNSISFINDIEKYISKYALVHLYLDNDSTGQKATQYLNDKYKVSIDKSSSYRNYKDLNDLLSHEKRKTT